MEKKHPAGIILMAIAAAVLITAGGYFAMWFYYDRADFICGTWINGIYCAGRTIEGVEAELTQNYMQGTLTVKTGGGSAETVMRSELAPLFSCSYSTQLALLGMRKEQTPSNWVIDTFHPKSYELEPEIQVIAGEQEQEALLAEYFACIREGGAAGEPEVRIEKGSEGYTLVDEKTHYFDVSLAARKIVEAAAAGEAELDLEQAGCYYDIPYTPEEQKIYELYRKLEAFQDCNIVYLFGQNREVVGPGVASGWMKLAEDGSFALDEEGELIADEEKIEAYIDALAEEYDTYGRVRQFHTTRGEVVTIEGGTYGNQIDRKKEKAYLKEAFERKAKEEHEPAYLKKAWAQGKDDIGNTYIEIDITEQTMYYYAEGECVISTPIVTGNMMRRRETPSAVCYIYAKQKNRVLRGPGYASHVDYWMPVKGGIGIHDAAWRDEFGGEIYKTDGSHGCINTPYEAAEKLFESASVGTPVVMFY